MYPVAQSKQTTLNIDYSRAVSVIASFKANGGFIPQYVQFTQPDESRLNLKIIRIAGIKERENSIVFRCVCESGRRHQEFNLKFYFKQLVWVVEN